MSKKTTSSVLTANATASEAATQPIVEPRARYGSIARKYEPALAARRDDQADRERDEEPASADARLRHRPRARRDEQRREHAERDQLAEGEVHDAGQTEDDRVADADEPVDGTGSEPARKDLQGQRHHAAL